VAALFGFIANIREGKLIALALMVAFAVIMSLNSARVRNSGPSPNRINLDRHSSLADRTKRSAKAFRFVLPAGSAMVFTPPAASTDRNDAQNFVSRSCRT
jgi:hypothetical protein